MAIKVNGTTVIDDSRNLSNVGGLKTVNGTSLVGSGNISAGASTTTGAVGTYAILRYTRKHRRLFYNSYKVQLWHCFWIISCDLQTMRGITHLAVALSGTWKFLHDTPGDSFISGGWYYRDPGYYL